MRAPRQRLRQRIGLTAATLILLLSACGVPLDDAPRAIADDELDTALLFTPFGTPEEIDDPSLEVSVIVHFVDPAGGEEGLGVLVPVSRRAVATPRGVLNALLEGPTEAEQLRGLTTALSDVAVQATSLVALQDNTGQAAFVELSEDSLASSSRNGQLTAFGQMVYTLTELDDIEFVTFTRDGTQTRFPTDAGSMDPGTAVGRSSFASLTPRPAVGFADETGPGPSRVSMYFLNQAKELQPVSRTIDPNPRDLLDDLFLGPSVSERSLQITTALTGAAAVRNIILESEFQTAIVDIAGSTLPDETEPELRRLAIAQIVYTISELPSVEMVIISVDNVAQNLDGALAEGESGQPFTRADFVDLLAFAP